jgi:epoxyqueuosine reductase
MDAHPRRRAKASSNQFIAKAIRKFVRSSSLNQLESFGGAPIFESPLVGFADGDDSIFEEYRRVVSEFHLTPREILTKHLVETLKVESLQLPDVSVISFVLPVTRETCSSNTLEKEGPSLRWNHTRWKGQAFINELSTYLVALIEGMGAYALAPELSPFYKISRTANGYAANWSQRHIAYAAGLGTFSLNEGFITRKGLAVRCGSVVTSLKLEQSPRPYANHLANCRFYAVGKCGVCIQRCPGGAISENGHDKLRCTEVLFEEQKPWLEGAHGPGYIGLYAGCGLCQTGVPCERRIPLRKSVK